MERCGLFVRLSSPSLWLFLNGIMRGKGKEKRAAHPVVHRTQDSALESIWHKHSFDILTQNRISTQYMQ